MKKVNKIICAIFVCVVVSITVVTVFARYVYKDNDVRTISSSKFYFRTDASTDINSEWDGKSTHSSVIHLYNYENSELFTKKDISYKVKYNRKSGDWSKADFELRDSSNNLITDNVYTLQGNKKTKEFYTVNLIPVGTGITGVYSFEVVFESSLPYQKEIKIDYTIDIGSSHKYNYDVYVADNNQYASVNVDVIRSYDKDLVIRYNKDTLIFDKSSLLAGDAVVTTDENYEILTISSDDFITENVYTFNFIIKNNNFNKSTDLIVSEQ